MESAVFVKDAILAALGTSCARDCPPPWRNMSDKDVLGLARFVAKMVEDPKLRSILDDTEEIDKALRHLRTTRYSYANMPPEIVVHICEALESGSADFLAASRVCQAWRNTIIAAPLLWRDLKISRFDKNPALKACVFVKRTGHLGLRNIEIDMTFDWDNPDTRPKRVSPRGDKPSTFQQILFGIDTATAIGVVHRLDSFKYYSENGWHGFDMTYLLRFLLRPYVQPRVVHLNSDDETCDWGWFHAVPLIPAFNSRLEEFLVKGRAHVRYRFTADPDIHLSSRLYSLKMCHIGIEPAGFGSKNDAATIIHGLNRAVHARPEFKVVYRGPDITYNNVKPGSVDLALVQAEVLLDGWTTAARRGYRESNAASSPRIVLPRLRELLLGLDKFDILDRFDTPALETVSVGMPFWSPYNARFIEIEREFTKQLRRLGSHLKMLDLSVTSLGKVELFDDLHGICPNLEELRISWDRDFEVHKWINHYVERKTQSTVGTQRLKRLCLGQSGPNPDDRTWLEDHVDEVLSGMNFKTLSDAEDHEDLRVNKYRQE